MAVVRTKVLPLGNHKAPAANVVVTSERNKHFQSKFRELKGKGHKFGVPWGHSKKAMPDAQDFFNSRFNAGYIQDLELASDGSLEAILDCPGLKKGADGCLVGEATLPDGTKVQTAISEVSAMILPEWESGKHEKHNDVIGHIALTTLPVVADQCGFVALSSSAEGIYLSTLTLSTEGDPDLKKDISKVAPKDDDEKPEEDLETILSPQPDKSGDQVRRIVELLTKAGSPLPEDTSADNILDRLEVALGVLLAAHQSKLESVAREAQTDNPGDVVEESGPAGGTVMMSTLAKENPTVRKLLAKMVTDKRASRHERIEALKRRGLPVDEANKLETAKIYLSTTINENTGESVDDSTDQLIAVLERTLPKEEWAKTYLSTVAPTDSRVSASVTGDDTVMVGNVVMTQSQAADAKAMGAKV